MESFERPAEKIKLPEFQIMTDPEQRHEIARRLDELVQDVESRNIGQMVFLDKAARPLSTVFLDLWQRRFPEKSHPNVNYLNIGSEFAPWEDALFRMRPATPVKAEELARLKKDYRYLAQAEPGSTCLIFDEYSYSGFAKNRAHEVLQEAFPNLNFETYVLSQHGDPLFETPEGQSEGGLDRGTPWYRLQEVEGLEGITGTVDREGEPSIFAQALGRAKKKPAEKIAAARAEMAALEQKMRAEISQLSAALDAFLKEPKLPEAVETKVFAGDKPEIGRWARLVAERSYEAAQKLLPGLKDLLETAQADPSPAALDRIEGRIDYLEKIDGLFEFRTDDLPAELFEEARDRMGRRGRQVKLDVWKRFQPYLTRYQSAAFDKIHELFYEFTGDHLRWGLQEMDIKTAQENEQPRLERANQARIQLRQEMHALADEYWKTVTD